MNTIAFQKVFANLLNDKYHWTTLSVLWSFDWLYSITVLLKVDSVNTCVCLVTGSTLTEFKYIHIYYITIWLSSK